MLIMVGELTCDSQPQNATHMITATTEHGVCINLYLVTSCHTTLACGCSVLASSELKGAWEQQCLGPASQESHSWLTRLARADEF